ncbi:hypothetical protein [Cupriavidus sp. 8B]
MLPVPVHQEFHLLSAIPTWSWQTFLSKSGAMVNEPLLHLAMVRATQLGPTLGGNGYKAAHATASAALTVCLPHEDRKGWIMSPELGFVKDFNKTSFSGTLGAGLALLQMTAAGYIWGAHWEDCGAPTTGKRPDFVFFRPDYCGSVAIVKPDTIRRGPLTLGLANRFQSAHPLSPLCLALYKQCPCRPSPRKSAMRMRSDGQIRTSDQGDG